MKLSCKERQFRNGVLFFALSFSKTKKEVTTFPCRPTPRPLPFSSIVLFVSLFLSFPLTRGRKRNIYIYVCQRGERGEREQRRNKNSVIYMNNKFSQLKVTNMNPCSFNLAITSKMPSISKYHS